MCLLARRGPKRYRIALNTTIYSLYVSFYKSNCSVDTPLDQTLCIISAPNGCLQYYTGTTGTINSFNYGGAANTLLSASLVTGTRQMVNLNYGICIRMEAGFCSIQYAQVSLVEIRNWENIKARNCY